MVWSMFGFQEGEHMPGEETQETTIKDRGEDETTSKTVEEAFECDYEKSCTPLYKKIESAVSDTDWQPIVKFLDTGYWPGSLFMDSIPPAEQVRTWVTRFDPEDQTMVKWSQLPLHLAIVCNAPFKVIGRIVELYPQAVRCTDDQHMLPLHLALRHNASDEIVAYFLMQFPEAVNAKGKDNRTPIDCAMRAKDKLRGKILQIFVTKTKSKTVAGNSSSKEVQLLQASLNNKITQLEEAQSKLLDLKVAEDKIEEMEAAMSRRESELIQKIQQLEKMQEDMSNRATKTIKMLEDEKLMQEVEYQKTIDALRNENRILEEAHKVARDEEISLRQELDDVQQRLAEACTPAAYQSLKEEVETSKAARLEQSRSITSNEIDTLRRDLQRNLAESQNKADQNLRLMQQMVEELQGRITSGGAAQTNSELNSLREEVNILRKELKDREEATKIRAELEVLRNSMEKELKNSEGKTKDELETLKSVVEGMNVNKLETKTNEELSVLKHELEELKKEMKENELASKAREDVEELRAALEQQLSEARGKTRDELATMKKHVDSIHEDMNAANSQTEIFALKKELENVKAELRNNELALQTKNEVEELRKILEKEIETSRGQTKSELNNMMQHVEKIEGEMATKQSASQIASLLSDVEQLKEEMKEKEEASKMKLEMVVMKKALELEIRNSEGKTKDELTKMKKAVLSADEKKLDSKSLEELSSIKGELEALKNALKRKEETDQARKELDHLKVAVDRQLNVWEGDARDELVRMRKRISALYHDKLDTKSPEEWRSVLSAVSTLKKEVKGVEEALKVKHELEALKVSLESELETSDSKSEEELTAMKKAVDAIDFEHVDIKNRTEWDAIRRELQALKMELKEKEYGDVMFKKELEEMRLSQDATMSLDESKREKKGIRKLFSRWRKKSKKRSKNGSYEVESHDEMQVGESLGSEDKLETILPPSVAKGGPSKSKTSQGEGQKEEKQETASQYTVGRGAKTEKRTEETDGSTEEERDETATVKSSVSKSSKASKSSKVSKVSVSSKKSSKKTEDEVASEEVSKPYQMVHTVSKHMTEQGDIEVLSGPEDETNVAAF